MNEIVRMASVKPILYGVIKIVRRDGYEGVVDLRPVIASGEIVEFLRAERDRFADVAIDEFGHRLLWIADDGEEVDPGTESLRSRSERQGEPLRIAG